MEHEAAETQELCVQALRSVRSASDADLLATLNELEALVPHVEGDITLINTAAAHELLCISLDAMNCLRMPVAQAALRLFNNGLRDERLIDILAFDANLSVALDIMAACTCKCWILDDFTSASVLELSIRLYLRLAQKNGARIFVLLGESIYRLASSALRISLLCLGRCLVAPEGRTDPPCLVYCKSNNSSIFAEKLMRRNDLARRFAYQKPAVAAGQLFLLLLENADGIVCQVDAELEEVATCLVGRIPYAITSIYGQIIHKALHAIFPEAQGQRRGAVPAEEFDFYRKLAAYETNGTCMPQPQCSKGPFAYLWTAQAKQRVVYDGIAIHIRESNPVRGSCDPWRHNGINEMRLHNQKSKIFTVPLYAITHMRYEEKKIKLFFNQLLSEGMEPLIRSWRVRERGRGIAHPFGKCASVRREPAAYPLCSLRTWSSNWFCHLATQEMEAYDVAFVEGVIDEIREPLDTNQAEKLLAPSSLLWPNTTSKTSERQKLHNGRNGRPHQRIMFASTKDIDEDTTQAGLPRNGIDENRPNTADVRELICNQNGGFGSALLDIPLAVRCIVSIGNRASVFTPLRSAANAPENHWERGPDTLAACNHAEPPPPSKLAQWRRVSLATTKSCETDCGVLLSVTESDQSCHNNWEPVDEVEKAGALLQQQQQQQQQSEVDGCKPRSSPLKRCEYTSTDFALSQPTQKSLETAQLSEGGKDIEQLPAAGTIGAADASEVASASAACNDQIEKLQQLLMHQYPEKGRQRQREEVAESRHESETDESAPRSSVSILPEEHNCENLVYCSTAMRIQTKHIRKRPKGFTDKLVFDKSNVHPTVRPRSALRLTSSPLQHAPPFISSFPKDVEVENPSSVKFLVAHGQFYAQTKTFQELIKRRVQETKLSKVQEARHAVITLQQKIAKKLRTLLEVQNEEKNQLQLSFEQAKNNILSRVEQQIRATAELLPLSFSAPKALNAENAADTANKELQSLMDGMKRGIYDKLARATTVR
ncbi:uncharacterized protein LOC34619507 [Cyclospora cayetanensis]|uniref:Uncharacterized protein LOC34619507 n=1 Tax=Cyclospora cayetanensis TaxID=88456 RepID=A0A6P6S1G3_9EIME|nr:uncharacterized protein LOC34619507 [Cyclospora cayetanensis]